MAKVIPLPEINRGGVTYLIIPFLSGSPTLADVYNDSGQVCFCLLNKKHKTSNYNKHNLYFKFCIQNILDTQDGVPYTSCLKENSYQFNNIYQSMGDFDESLLSLGFNNPQGSSVQTGPL